jgi:hypothetical protein
VGGGLVGLHHEVTLASMVCKLMSEFEADICLKKEVHSFIHSFHWHVQNVTIPCRSQELLPFLSVIKERA